MTRKLFAKIVAKNDQKTTLDQLEGLAKDFKEVEAKLNTYVLGQEQVIRQTLVTLLAGGHVLLVGVPGVAKTRLVEGLGKVLGLQEQRIQCTPDLMPADIIGSEVLEEQSDGSRSFRFIQGPVFSQLLMADEINRASPRTQSALLQAMQEKEVTVAGKRLKLPQPFHVLATQNPLEQEGTYPLPEAQLDRFMMEVLVHFPTPEAEKRMLLLTTGKQEDDLSAVLSGERLLAYQSLVRQLPVSEQVLDAVLRVVGATRQQQKKALDLSEGLSGASLGKEQSPILWGAGPRASQALVLAAKARAALDGRLAPSVEDVRALSKPILRHRVALTFGAKAQGMTVDHLIDTILNDLQTQV